MRTKKVLINGHEYSYQSKVGVNDVTITIDDKDYSFSRDELCKINSYKSDEQTHIWNQDEYFIAEKLNLMTSNSKASAGSLKSPMPGKIFKVIKNEGEPVKAGETILILEAMKMEHSIKSPIDGVISTIKFQENDVVSGGVDLAEVVSE